jgi:hypothetical protein
VKVVLLAFVGLVLGAIAGAVVGVGAGLAWTTVFKTSGFEGYSGMLVFFTFMPIGAMLGALGGAIALGMVGARAPGEPSGPEAK